MIFFLVTYKRKFIPEDNKIEEEKKYIKIKLCKGKTTKRNIGIRKSIKINERDKLRRRKR